jgi:hypothetical protein
MRELMRESPRDVEFNVADEAMQARGNAPELRRNNPLAWIQGALVLVVLLKESHEAVEYLAHLLISLISG